MNRLHSCCTRGAAEGVDAWIYSSFSELNFQLSPAEIYLEERIDFLTSIPFYCMEERMEPGKLFFSVLL